MVPIQVKGVHVVQRQNNSYLNPSFFTRPLSNSMSKNFQNHNVEYSCWDFLPVISKYIVQNVRLAIWYQYSGMSYGDLWMKLCCRADCLELKHSLQKVERRPPNSRSKQTLEVNEPHLSVKADPLPDSRVTGLLHKGYRCSKQMLGQRLSCWATDSFLQPAELLACCPKSSNFCELPVVLRCSSWYRSCFWISNSSHIVL